MTLMKGTEESEQKRQFSADHTLQTYTPHLICCQTCNAHKVTRVLLQCLLSWDCIS